MNPFIKTAADLVTSREETRAGFIAMALEKNYLAKNYIVEAKSLKALSSQAAKPIDLLQITGLRSGLLTASGLSDKALNYLTEDDRTLAIKGLIEEFLEPAGESFADELVYRYLLTKGDALGGQARNLAGSLGERKFLLALISVLNLGGTPFQWKDKSGKWLPKSDDIDIKRIKSLYWKQGTEDRLLLLNIKVPAVGKNVDLCILSGTPQDATSQIINAADKYVALGELKGGIDPAGADEHWKTANSALNRIRTGFTTVNHTPGSFFIGAAIENSMAIEIFNQLQSNAMTNAANLSNNDQLAAVCQWITNL